MNEIDLAAKVARLEKKNKDLTEQRDNLVRMNKKLSANLDALEAKSEQEFREARIRLEWQRMTDATYKSVIKFLSQMPMPIDMQVLEPDDWARLDQLVGVFRRGIEECNKLRTNSASTVVEASE